jgi:glycosyltransferase involved in cell wall biosynthesis|tara:strand:- start:1185 stop:1886 length:702 start_codon:yes stop_codon:yes gene_type:complete
MKDIKLSIVIPCYNEERTIRSIVNKVMEQKKLIKEIIIIDDKSTDSSRNIIKELSEQNTEIKYFFKEENEGKGSALKKGFELSTGDIILIQDADLEYDPSEYSKLIKPFVVSNADVVYGSRFLGGDYVRLHFFFHSIANKLLTFFCNLVTNLNMSDMETGYKLIKREHLNKINLKEKSFGIEPELTVKLSKKKLIFYEVPISYKGRSYEEGKKIRFKDVLTALYCIFIYKFFD